MTCLLVCLQHVDDMRNLSNMSFAYNKIKFIQLIIGEHADYGLFFIN